MKFCTSNNCIIKMKLTATIFLMTSFDIKWWALANELCPKLGFGGFKVSFPTKSVSNILFKHTLMVFQEQQNQKPKATTCQDNARNPNLHVKRQFKDTKCMWGFREWDLLHKKSKQQVAPVNSQWQ